MVERRDLGSWLGGPSAEPAPAGGSGLPTEGRGAVAGFGRRLVALVVDWVACLMVSSVFFRDPSSSVPLTNGSPWATLAIFAVENVLLVGTLGHTLGHRLLGLRVRRLVVGQGSEADVPDERTGSVLPDDGRAPGLARAALRTALLLLVVPPAVQDGLGRGLHDRLAGTAIVNR